MSRNRDFVVDDGNREMIELLELLETGYIRSNSQNPADSECTENTQPTDTSEVEKRIYLENKLREVNIADELVRKVNERIQDVAILQQNYKQRAIRIEKLFASKLDTARNTVEFVGNRSTVPVVNRDEYNPVAYADILSASEEISKLALELSLPNESQKSIVQQIINTAQLPGLPILATEPSFKPIAPAPELRLHLQNEQIVVTWFMPEKQDLSAYEPMLSYQVYCCKETNKPPTAATWWKLVELSANPLPMLYVVDKLHAGKYYFAVRGIDVQKRIGPFSTPVSIILAVCQGRKSVARN